MNTEKTPILSDQTQQYPTTTPQYPTYPDQYPQQPQQQYGGGYNAPQVYGQPPQGAFHAAPYPSQVVIQSSQQQVQPAVFIVPTYLYSADYFASRSLVCGILSLVLIPVLFSSLAIVYGARALRMADPARDETNVRARAITGIVLGILSIVLVIVLTVVIMWLNLSYW